jgi:hypothetical protein
MPLTTSTTLDAATGTQTIFFYEGANLVDEVIYASNSVTFSAISSFNLDKADLIFYIQALKIFANVLLLNFTVLSSSINASWPVCEMQISNMLEGVTHLDYQQTSGANTVISIDYIPSASSSSVAARASPVSVTPQEFFGFIYMMAQYSNQISLN